MTAPLIPNRNIPPSTAVGAQLSWLSNTTLQMAAGNWFDSTNTIDITLGNVGVAGPSVTTPITINGAINGYNGLDTGSLGANTWYAVYIIQDSKYFNAPGALLTLASNVVAGTPPALPIGYDTYRLRGYILTDGSSHFLPFYMVGSGADIMHVWTNSISVLSGVSPTTYTAQSLALAVPPVAQAYVLFDYAFTPAAAGNQFYLRPTGANATITNSTTTASGAAMGIIQAGNISCLALLATSASSIDYKTASNSDSLNLSVLSFRYSV